MKKVLLLFMLCVCVSIGAWADTKTISLSEAVASLNSSGFYTYDGFTLRVTGGGNAASYDTSSGSATLPQNCQLIISSASHAMTQVVFSNITSSDAGTTGTFGAFTGNTFNGSFSVSGTTGTWTKNTAFTNEHTIVFSVTGDEAGDAVILSDYITITYDGATSTAKKRPDVTVDPTGFTGENAVQPNFDKLAEPSVVLTHSGANVTPYYQVNYYIKGQPTEGLSTNSRGAEYTQDPSTGSQVERVYGQFLAGSKAGTVTVMIVAVPRNAYAGQYDIVESSYDVEIKKIKPVAGFTHSMPEGGITLNVTQTISQMANSKWQYQNSYEEVGLPEYTLDYTLPSGAKVSALDYFDVTIEHLDKDKNVISTESNTYPVWMKIDTTHEPQDSITVSSTASKEVVTDPTFVNEEAATAAATASVVTGTNYVRYTFTPKSGYADTYDTPDALEVPVTVGTIKGKIELVMSGLPTETVQLYKYNQDGLSSFHPDRLPLPTLKDQNHKELIVTGNPITYNYVIVNDSVYYDDCIQDTIWPGVTKGPQQVGQQTGIQLQYNAGNGTHGVQTGKAGMTKVMVWASVAPWNTAYDNVFKMYDDEYPDLKDGFGNKATKIITEPQYFYIETLKRAPYVVIRDLEGNELDKIDVYEGQEITFNNLYDIAGRFDDDENHATALGSTPEDLEFASSSNPNGFWYTFNVPAYLMQGDNPKMQVLNWPTSSVIETIKYKESSDGEVNGFPAHTAGQDSIYLYHSDKGYNDAYRSWQIKFNADGNYPITYTIHAWNHVKWDVSSESSKKIIFEVTDKIKPVLVIDPVEKFAKKGDGLDFTEPTVKVMAGSEDVTAKYNITYAIEGGSESSDGKASVSTRTGTKIIKDDIEADPGTITPGYTASTAYLAGEVYIGDVAIGVETVNVTATVLDGFKDGYANPNPGTYRIKITEDDFKYEIMNSCDDPTAITDSPDLLGKFHILSGSKISSGTTITGVPGVDITFGDYKDDVVWSIQSTDFNHTECTHASKVHIVNGGQVEIDDEGMPTEGGYMVFSPYANGYLTVDARWEANTTYRLICKTEDGTIWKEDYTPATDVNGEYTFKKALMAGNKYYLYDLTKGDLNLHGANYTPAYVANRNVAKGTEATATIFMNGYQPDLPKIISDATGYVTFVSEAGAYATVNEQGTITPVKNTYDYDAPGDENEKYVKITATVKSSKTTDCSSLSKTADLFVFISEIPTYWVPDQADENAIMPDAGSVVTTTNIPTNIKMTFGGWKSGTIANRAGKTDNWTFKGKANRIGGGETDDDLTYNQYLDGFSCYVAGNNDPIDEKGKKYGSYQYHRGSAKDYDTYDEPYYNATDKRKETQKAMYKGSFTVPVAGSFVKFEPRESGTLFIYIVQNGACDYTGKNKAESNFKMKWRPLYITDERGEPVTMNDHLTTIKDLLPSGSDAATHLGSYTRGIIRSTCNDIDIVNVVGDNKNAIVGMTETANCAYDWSEFVGTAQDADNLIKVWKGKSLRDREDVIRLDNGGYTLVHKAYVRYTFDVKAGKTYFVFQNGSKFEFGGFSFVPNGFPNGSYNQTNGKEQKVLPVQEYSDFTAAVDDYDYTVQHHSYTAGNWTSICLPFSVQESQVKEIFGDDVMVLTCDSVIKKNNYLHFTQHAYRMLEAGRPYLIKPSQMSNTQYSTDNGGSVTFKHVSIEMTEAGKAVDPGIYNVSLLDDFYVFKGLYKGKDMPAYSYFAAADGLYRYSNVYEDSDGTKMSYRAYLHTDKGEAAKSKGFNMVFEDAVDGMDEGSLVTGILFVDADNEMNVLLGDDRIFNMQGVYVGRGIEQLQSLPKGIYIIGGQKYIVK